MSDDKKTEPEYDDECSDLQDWKDEEKDSKKSK